MAVWRVLLNVSLADLRLHVAGIDVSEFEWAHASAHYTNLTIQQLKPTLMVDMATNAIYTRYPRDDDTEARYPNRATGGDTQRSVDYNAGQ